MDAVTLDAMGTLLRLDAPVERLAEAAGIAAEAAARGFAAEVAYYVPRSLEGRRGLAGPPPGRLDGGLQRGGGRRSDAGAVRGGDRLRARAGRARRRAPAAARGLALCVVSNWDCALREHLAALGFALDVVTSAEVGAAKPDPRIFRIALDRLRVRPERALHAGDSADDEAGAAAVGMRFAAAPLEALL